MKKQIAFADWHDPLSPRTWSGTPFNISQAWKNEVDIVPLGCRPSSAVVAMHYTWDQVRGHNRRYSQRRMCAQSCARLSANLPASCAGILHMNTWSVPFAPDSKKHFLLVDSLCEFWKKSGANKNYSTRDWKEYEADDQNALNRCDLIFSISDFLKDMMVSHYGIDASKIVVVGTGRGQIKPLEGSKSYQGKNILMVAQQRFIDKGGDILVQAVKIARQSDPEITLTLVSPPEHEALAGGPVEGVTYTGRLPWDDLQRLFDEAALFAMPAQSEPWGLSYVEALSSKTPVLGLNRAALPEITQNGRFGFLCDDPAPETIAATLLEALHDAARLEKMGKEGQAFVVEHFTWENTAKRIENAIWS